jgi:hypothetical protein
MHIFYHLNLVHLMAQFSMVCVLAAVFTGNIGLIMPSMCLGADQSKAVAAADDDESDDWMFDKSTYTNSPKTGKRVDQYKREKVAYRDPNALFDSPTGDFLFTGGPWGDFYGSGYMFTYYENLLQEYGKDYVGEDGSGYYPYDGDPNDEDNGKKERMR